MFHCKNATAIIVVFCFTFQAVAQEKAISDYSNKDLEKAGWALPLKSGQDIPDHGYSLFDKLFSTRINGKSVYKIPYPVNKVVEQLKEYIHQDNPELLRTVLIPQGRSLQRNTALLGIPYSTSEKKMDDEVFFHYPRLILAVDSSTNDPKNPLKLDLKDKFYLGFHEKAQILEIISYNEAEGRFEYQVVKNYNKRKKPEVFYAQRTLCLSCHQNQTPIFSLGPWDETNANPTVAKKLGKSLGKNYFGVSTKASLDKVYAFDTATDAANYFPVYNKMWDELCSSTDCRQESIYLILKNIFFPQSGNKDADIKKYNNDFASAWSKKWPYGVKIANPNIPNRNLNTPQDEQSFRPFVIPLELEPLTQRKPLELWKSYAVDENNLNRMLLGFKNQISLYDVQFLKKLMKNPQTEKKLREIVFNVFTEKNLNQEFSRDFILQTVAHYYKYSPQNALEDQLFTTLERKVDRGPAQDFVSSVVDVETKKTFQNSCANCHYSENTVPPPFLGGLFKTTDFANETHQRIEKCAQRMLYRLKLNNCPVDSQTTITPMPPDYWLKSNSLDAKAWYQEFGAEIENYLVRVLKQDSSKTTQKLIHEKCPKNIDYQKLSACAF